MDLLYEFSTSGLVGCQLGVYFTHNWGEEVDMLLPNIQNPLVIVQEGVNPAGTSRIVTRSARSESGAAPTSAVWCVGWMVLVDKLDDAAEALRTIRSRIRAAWFSG